MAGARSVIINLIANERISEAVNSAGRSLDRLNTKINSTLKEGAKKGAMAGGVAAGGAFVAGLSGMIQLDNTRAKIEAQLGLTKQESGRIGGVAGKLFAAAYGDSMDEVNNAVVSVVQNMDGMKNASSSALQTMTARAMDVATVMDEDVGNVTKAVSQMLKTGLAKNAQEAFDIITRGAQTGGNKAQDLLDTFNEYGTQFRKLGLSGQTAMGLIQQGLKGGARDADLVADSLKEFSIRAIDGSSSTIAGYKALGLNAKQMAKMIAAGGPTAAKGLDMVMDRLRAMKNPINQASTATALFGTQSEDLGKALFTMDPSSAVQALGQVSGAADKAGAALGGTAQAKFESFKRTLQQDVQAALANTVAWFGKHQTVLKTLVGVIASAVVVWGTYNTVASIVALRTALMTEGTVANMIVTKIAAAATKTWAAAQWLWNAAMSANPIGLVIIAIVALVAAIVIAYRNSATFRAIVQAAWAGIKQAAVAAWSVIRGVLTALWGFIQTYVLPVFRFLWATVKLVWAGIMLAIRAAWVIIGPVFRAISTVIHAVLVVAFTVLKNAIKIVWIAIQIYIRVAWLVIRGYFNAIKAFIQTVLAPAFKWFYNNVIKPVWNFIKVTIQANWLAIRAIFNIIKTYLSSTLGPAFRNFKAAASAAWSALRSSMSTVWNSGIKPIFNGIKTAVGAVKSAFGHAIDGIRTIWNKLISIAKVPVNFVIGMYNHGIVGLVNGIAKVAGIGTRLTPLHTFARGGVMPGYSPGRDSLLAAVSPGESIFRPEFTKAVGSSWVHAANSVARTQGPAGVRKWMAGGKRLGGEGAGFSRGGTVGGFAGHFDIGGIVGGWVNKAKNWALGNVAKAARGILGKILNVSVPGQGLFHDVVQGIPGWIKDHMFGWLKDKAGGAGGPGMQRALAFAKSQSGKPYVWGGVGPGGYDCSGFMSAITNVIHGKSPYSRLYSTHSFGSGGGPGGFVRNLRSGFMVGVTNAGVGHMAGTLLGTNVESNGSQGVHYGPGARGAYNGLFGAQYGLKADTGRLALKRGWNPPVFNGTGKPELLSTAAAGGGDLHFHNAGVIGSQAELERWLAKSMERMRRQGKLPGVS